MPACELCGEDFSIKGGRGDNNRVSCYACTDRPESRSKNYRNKHMKRKYGITLYDFSQMYQKQRGCCAVCKTSIRNCGENLRLGDTRAKDEPCVDHCHNTGKVRGLLCFHCNTALGHVFDNVVILDALKSYLTNE